jgi:hypothetical protein
MMTTQPNDLDQELVEDIALRTLEKMNPTLNGSPLTEKAKKYFLSEIRSRRWELGRGRQVTPLTETGAVLSDAHGWPVSFQDAIKSIASELFDLPEQESAPEKMTEQEYISAMQKAETPEQQIALMNAWTGQQTKK